MLITWVISRLLLLPFHVIRSAYFESKQFIPLDVLPFYYLFNYALMSLVVLHIYWFMLMIKVAQRASKTNSIHDVRESPSLSKKKKH